jgi:hypothetical protein
VEVAVGVLMGRIERGDGEEGMELVREIVEAGMQCEGSYYFFCIIRRCANAGNYSLYVSTNSEID